jgi:hypothetical protein
VIKHNVCADLVVSHDHNFVESLQVDNHCLVISDLFCALIWLIDMVLCTHISITMHVNKLGDMEMNTHDIIVLALEHNQNLRADLIELHVDMNDEFDHNICDANNICTLIDPCDVLHLNKFHPVYLTTSVEFFKKRSPTNCLFYTILDTPIDVKKMLENIYEIKFTRSLNTIHSCKLTFILIGEHVVHCFYVHAICIAFDKLPDLK